MPDPIIACASLTTKSRGNQDYCCKVSNSQVGFSGIIIADGIGSHKMSDISSKFCCEELKIILEKVSTTNDIDFTTFFTLVKRNLIEYSKTLDVKGETIESLRLGTTLICVLSFEYHYDIAYVGNGSVWHTAVGFDEFSKHVCIPWNSINLLNPHSVEIQGKSHLTHYISVTEAPETPTVLRVSKDHKGKGEIIIITTDGIFSNDNMVTGMDEENRMWTLLDKNMEMLYKSVSVFFRQDLKEKKDEELETMLKDYLFQMKQDNSIHDDTTAGIILSSKAITYYQQKWEQQNNNHETNKGD